MTRCSRLLACVLLALALASPVAAAARENRDYAGRKDVREFIAERSEFSLP